MLCLQRTRRKSARKEGKFPVHPCMIAHIILSKKQHPTKRFHRTEQIGDHNAMVRMGIRTELSWLFNPSLFVGIFRLGDLRIYHGHLIQLYLDLHQRRLSSLILPTCCRAFCIRACCRRTRLCSSWSWCVRLPSLLCFFPFPSLPFFPIYPI